MASTVLFLEIKIVSTLLDDYLTLWKEFSKAANMVRHRNHNHFTGKLLLGPDGHCASRGDCNMQANYKRSRLVIMAHWGDYDMRKALQYARLAKTVLLRVREEFEEEFGDVDDDDDDEGNAAPASTSTDDSAIQPFTNFIQGNSESVRSFDYGGVISFRDSAEHLKEGLATLAKSLKIERDAPALIDWLIKVRGATRDEALGIHHDLRRAPGQRLLELGGL